MLKAVLVLSVSLTCLHGAVIVSSAQCATENGPTVNAISACISSGYHVYPPGSSFPPQQTARVQNTIVSNQISASGFSANFLTNLEGTDYARAVSDMSYTIALTTAGPVRTGILRGIFSGDVFHDGGNGNFGYNFPNRPSFETFGPSLPIYITLGQPFTFSAFLHGEGPPDVPGIPSEVSINVLIDLHFYEADGVTPVAISETPEPASFLLMLVPLSGIFFAVLRLRREDGKAEFQRRRLTRLSFAPRLRRR